MNRTRTLVALSSLLLATCGGGGGGGGSNTTPAAPSTPAGGSGGAAATVRITSSGVSPKSVRVEMGAQVMFVNEDSRSHEMMSDPHPVHTGCPEINSVGDLGPGQSRMTSPFRTARNCGFHDNRLDGETALRGTIQVGEGGDPGPGY